MVAVLVSDSMYMGISKCVGESDNVHGCTEVCVVFCVHIGFMGCVSDDGCRGV